MNRKQRRVARVGGKSASGVDQLLAEFRRRYADAVTMHGALNVDKAGGALDWPEWCWVPMAGTDSYLTNRGVTRNDIGRVAALTQWELGRGVYRPQRDVVNTAVSAMNRISGDASKWKQLTLPGVEEWAGLPQWCCYVEWPAESALNLPEFTTPRGIFVHLEHDSNTGRPELRLLIDHDGTWDGLSPIAVYLNRSNLGAAVADYAAVADAGGRGIAGADIYRAPPSILGELVGKQVWLLLPVVLPLIDPAARFHSLERPHRDPMPAEPGPRGWRPALSTTHWTVSY